PTEIYTLSLHDAFRSRVLFEEALRESASQPHLPDSPNPRRDSEIVTIIYTSGTSGEPKGVCLNVGNLTHMLSCTTERLDQESMRSEEHTSELQSRGHL